MSKLAIILVRGRVKVNSDILTTLDTFNLRKKHACTIVDDTPSVRGRLQKVQGMVTFGEVSDETVALLKDKATACSTKDNVYFLAPPKGGFERKGIKVAYKAGGALGNRGEAINSLISSMVQ